MHLSFSEPHDWFWRTLFSERTCFSRTWEKRIKIVFQVPIKHPSKKTLEDRCLGRTFALICNADFYQLLLSRIFLNVFEAFFPSMINPVHWFALNKLFLKEVKVTRFKGSYQISLPYKYKVLSYAKGQTPDLLIKSKIPSTKGT